MRAIAALVERGDSYHRVPLTDALIAAIRRAAFITLSRRLGGAVACRAGAWRPPGTPVFDGSGS